MSKEYLEAFKIVYNNFDYLISDVVIENDDVNICLKTIKEQLPTIKQALHRLESIDNANPSEALNVLKATEKYTGIDLTVVKNALLKAQKEHKALDLLMQELDCKDFADLRKYARCGYDKMNEKLIQ